MAMIDATGKPLVIRGARAFLLVVAVTWGLGTVQGSMHLAGGVSAGETVSDLRTDVVALALRALLFAAALVSLSGINRRRAVGRWGTVGLACVAVYLAAPAVALAWRAVWGDYAAPARYFAYSSTEDAVIGLLVAGSIICAIGVLIVQLTIGETAARFFRVPPPHTQ